MQDSTTKLQFISTNVWRNTKSEIKVTKPVKIGDGPLVLPVYLGGSRHGHFGAVFIAPKDKEPNSEMIVGYCDGLYTKRRAKQIMNFIEPYFDPEVAAFNIIKVVEQDDGGDFLWSCAFIVAGITWFVKHGASFADIVHIKLDNDGILEWFKKTVLTADFSERPPTIEEIRASPFKHITVDKGSETIAFKHICWQDPKKISWKKQPAKRLWWYKDVVHALLKGIASADLDDPDTSAYFMAKYIGEMSQQERQQIEDDNSEKKALSEDKSTDKGDEYDYAREEATVEFQYAKAKAVQTKLLGQVAKYTYNGGYGEMIVIGRTLVKLAVCDPIRIRIFQLHGDTRFYTDRSVGIKTKFFAHVDSDNAERGDWTMITLLWHHGSKEAEDAHFAQCGHFGILWTDNLEDKRKNKNADKRRFYSDSMHSEEFVYQAVANMGACMYACIAEYLNSLQADVHAFRDKLS